MIHINSLFVVITFLVHVLGALEDNKNQEREIFFQIFI